jgi:hypothetical protein
MTAPIQQLSLRDYFAAQALAACSTLAFSNAAARAKWAYAQADAMLAVRCADEMNAARLRRAGEEGGAE